MSVKPTKYCIDPRALAGSVPYVPVARCTMHIGKFFLIIVRYVKYVAYTLQLLDGGGDNKHNSRPCVAVTPSLTSVALLLFFL